MGSGRRPVIGISAYREPADWGSWQRVSAALLPGRYLDAISASGGTPVVLAPFGPHDDVPGVVARLDGLLIAGGADVNPSRYGQTPHVATADWRDDRDVSEFALLDAAGDRGLPVLGICRGMQVMAVHAGGRLHQHVPDVVGHDRHSGGPGAYHPTAITPVPGTRVADILGSAATVPCHHHQSVADHPGFIPAAHADDGLLEAMEDPGHPFRLALQSHPETGADLRIFRAFTAAC